MVKSFFSTESGAGNVCKKSRMENQFLWKVYNHQVAFSSPLKHPVRNKKLKGMRQIRIEIIDPGYHIERYAIPEIRFRLKIGNIGT